MKLLLSFVKAKEEEYTPKQIHLWCECMIYWGGGGGGLVDMPTHEQNIAAVNHQSLRNFQTNG